MELYGDFFTSILTYGSTGDGGGAGNGDEDGIPPEILIVKEGFESEVASLFTVEEVSIIVILDV